MDPGGLSVDTRHSPDYRLVDLKGRRLVAVSHPVIFEAHHGVVDRPIVPIETAGERGDARGGTVDLNEGPEQLEPAVDEDLPAIALVETQSAVVWETALRGWNFLS